MVTKVKESWTTKGSRFFFWSGEAPFSDKPFSTEIPLFISFYSAMEGINPFLQDGAPGRARVQLLYKWLKSLVYGIYNELDNYGTHEFYKST